MHAYIHACMHVNGSVTRCFLTRSVVSNYARAASRRLSCPHSARNSTTAPMSSRYKLVMADCATFKTHSYNASETQIESIQINGTTDVRQRTFSFLFAARLSSAITVHAQGTSRKSVESAALHPSNYCLDSPSMFARAPVHEQTLG